MPASGFQIHGYFFIYDRLPSALFDTLEDAEDTADYLRNHSTHEITFYHATKINGFKLIITYIQHWNAKE